MQKIKKWDVFEIKLKANELSDAEYGFDVYACFKCKDREYNIKGYWLGGLYYQVRFCPECEGIWSYEIKSVDNGLCKSGEFECVLNSETEHGFIRRDKNDCYHFSYDDDTHYFMFGTTLYHLSRVSSRHWKECIDGAISYGINKARLHVGATPGFDSARDYYTSKYVEDWMRERLNSGYDLRFVSSFEIYDNLDAIVKYMKERGFVADILMIAQEGRTLRKTDERHFEYIINRYAAFTNVIWDLCNEWNYHKPVDLDYFVKMGQLVYDNDPYNKYHDRARLLSVHQKTMIDFLYFDKGFATHAIVQYGVRNGIVPVDDEWGDADINKTKYRYGDDWGHKSIEYNFGRGIPVVNDEFGYMGEYEDRSEERLESGEFPWLSRQKHRRIMWGIYASCGYGSTGDKYLHEETGVRPYFACQWSDCEEYKDVKFLVNFFEKIEYWKLLPAMDLVTKGERVYVSAQSAKQYLIYAACGGEVEVKIENGDYNLQIINLETGITEEKTLSSDKLKYELENDFDYLLYLRNKNC